MQILIEDLKFKTIIGILEFERVKPQDVIVDIAINYNYKKNGFIDYAKVVKIIKSTIKKQKFLLLEDAIEFLSKKLHKKFNNIEKLTIKITKPSILKDCKVSLKQKYRFTSLN